MDKTIIEKIKKEIQNFAPAAEKETVGRVVKVGDGVAEIEGLENVMMMEMVQFNTADGKSLKESLKSDDALYGLALNLEEDSVKVVILGDTAGVSEGMTVSSTGRVLSIPVGDGLIGRVVNPLGEAIDGKGAIKNTKHVPIEREAYGVLDRKGVHEPMHTGIKAIDAMIPIGRGQRELIIGDRFTGKTTIAIDTIINQKSEPKDSRPFCIYVAIGQKESKTARIMQQLQDAGALEYTIIVSAPASAPAAMQFLAPFAGAAIGEYFMDQGKHAVVVYDDLSKQAVAYRELSLLLRRPPGREAYPGDIFYLHSRLLERAAKLSDAKGGGSLTALPVIETQEGDISAYIPTNVISITDGQIFVEADLFNKGIRPAVNVGTSVSRVGSSAQTKAMKSVAGTLRLELAQFRELEAFMQFAQDLDETTAKRIDSGRRMVEVLKQNNGEPLGFEEQVVVLFAAQAGFFNDIQVNDIRSQELKLVEYLHNQHEGIFKDIKDSLKLEDATKAKLNEAFARFKEAQK
jgi:F-type H+-transporting ATPase subunit alpha